MEIPTLNCFALKVTDGDISEERLGEVKDYAEG